MRRVLNVASILCCLMCVVFLTLWVRSYQRWDKFRVRLTSRRVFSAEILQGRAMFNAFQIEPDTNWQSTIGSGPIEKSMKFWDPHLEKTCLSPLGLDAYFSQPASTVIVPYWLCVFASGALAMLMQLRWPWRFNLRHLFIAITYPAIVLGLSAWLDQTWIGQ
jgi:hypothetical protein